MGEIINIHYYLEKYEEYRQQDPKNHNLDFSQWIELQEPLVVDKKSEIFVCPKCNGEKTIEDPCGAPSPQIGGGYYKPECPLCDAKGYIIREGN